MATKKIKNFAAANNISLEWADIISGEYGGKASDITKVNGTDDYLVIFCWDGGIDVSSGDISHVENCCLEKFYNDDAQDMSIYDRHGNEKRPRITITLD